MYLPELLRRAVALDADDVFEFFVAGLDVGIEAEEAAKIQFALDFDLERFKLDVVHRAASDVADILMTHDAELRGTADAKRPAPRSKAARCCVLSKHCYESVSPTADPNQTCQAEQRQSTRGGDDHYVNILRVESTQHGGV